jgi:serine protease Do
MENIIEKLKSIVVQIATPFSTGTGFYVPQSKFIITNEHVIHSCRDIVIEDQNKQRQRGKIVFADEAHDLALLKIDKPMRSNYSELEFALDIEMGQEVIALGHPYGLSFSSTLGIVSNKNLEINDTSYIMHDAVLNPGNSGGPLVDIQGRLVGINSSIFQDGKNISVALGADLIKKAIDDYLESGYQSAVRCPSCNTSVEDHEHASGFCLSCGCKVNLFSLIPLYKPSGLANKIEQILETMAYDAVLCRRGQFSWEIEKGSAKVQLNYHPKKGYLLAQSILSQIPGHNAVELYEFLLKANYEAKGITFSVDQNIIIASLLLYDQQMNEEVTLHLLQQLLEKSDHYDDIILRQFG